MYYGDFRHYTNFQLPLYMYSVCILQIVDGLTLDICIHFCREVKAGLGRRNASSAVFVMDRRGCRLVESSPVCTAGEWCWRDTCKFSGIWQTYTTVQFFFFLETFPNFNSHKAKKTAKMTHPKK